VLDTASRLLHESRAARPLTAAEAAEQRRRTLLMVLYLFRHPVFAYVEMAAKMVPLGWLDRVTWLRAVVHALAAYVKTYPDRYFYTATN